MKRQEILINEGLEEITFRIKRVAPKIYEDQLEELEACGIFNSYEGYTGELNSTGLTLEMIYKEACGYINVSPDVVKSKTRKRECVKARRYFALTAREIFGNKHTLSAMGEVIGGKDHSTILHYYRDYDGKKDVDFRLGFKTSKEDSEAITAIKNRLNGHYLEYKKNLIQTTNGR